MEAIDHQGYERLAVGLFVEGAVAVGSADPEIFNHRRYVIEALSAKEEAVGGAWNTLCDA